MKKSIVYAMFFLAAVLLISPGCSSKPKFDVTGKWEATIKYSSGESFSPEWVFKKDGAFHEFGGDVWGNYTVKGDKIKIISKDEKEYYSGTITKKTHMSGKFVYVGFEDKQSITWEAVKVDE